MRTRLSASSWEPEPIRGVSMPLSFVIPLPSHFPALARFGAGQRESDALTTHTGSGHGPADGPRISGSFPIPETRRSRLAALQYCSCIQLSQPTYPLLGYPLTYRVIPDVRHGPDQAGGLALEF